MNAFTNRRGAVGRQRSARTVVATALLLLLALPFAAWGVMLLNEVRVRGHVPGGSGGVFEAMVGLGIAFLLVAAIHLAAAASTWRDPAHSSGRMVGLAGLVLGLAAVGLVLSGGALDVFIFVVTVPIAYGAVLLLLGKRTTV